jgi:hypothetical protein
MSSTPANELPRQDLPFLVTSIALLQLVGGLSALFFFGIQLWLLVWSAHETQPTAILWLVFGVPFCLSILSIVGAVGLLRLKQWGRRASLLLVSLSTVSCVLFLLFYHPQVQRGLQNVDDPFDITRPIAKILLVVFVFVSLCYWTLLNSYPAESP